jgi:hypothetical protein
VPVGSDCSGRVGDDISDAMDQGDSLLQETLVEKKTWKLITVVEVYSVGVLGGAGKCNEVLCCSCF